MSGRPSRKHAILEALARELERQPWSRITTSGLARAAGVSEAALYRHFASKAQMFDALIGFAEASVFARVNQVLAEERQARIRCGALLYLMLGFAERNPGITRVLLGDVLIGENERLRGRADRFFGRFETQLKQVLREAPLREAAANPIGAAQTAELLLAIVEGRLHRFLRSGFGFLPTVGWDIQWEQLTRALFRPESV